MDHWIMLLLYCEMYKLYVSWKAKHILNITVRGQIRGFYTTFKPGVTLTPLRSYEL
jgi:hypothetical protein